MMTHASNSSIWEAEIYEYLWVPGPAKPELNSKTLSQKIINGILKNQKSSKCPDSLLNKTKKKKKSFWAWDKKPATQSVRLTQTT